MDRVRIACTALALLLVGFVACSDDSSDRGRAQTPAVIFTTATDAAVVLTGADPAELSSQASAALIESSPVVVLTDEAHAADGATQAKELGVPLLISNQRAASATTQTPAVAESVEAATDPVGVEITRLNATHALVLGEATLPVGVQDVTAVTQANELPAFDRGETGSDVIVLTDGLTEMTPEISAADPPQDALALAGSATGDAIGATILPAPLGDPRLVDATIKALAAASPALVVGVGASFGTPELLAQRVDQASSGHILPGGGQLVAHNKLYVALYGHPGTPSLGVLGEQELDAAIARAHEHALQYTDLTAKTVVPMFEIIATVASAELGDGDYSRETDVTALQPWVEQAQAEGIYVIFDLQPGTDDLVDQAKLYESLLAYPHVGLAIDPEWKLQPGQRHLRQIGQVDVAEVNRVIEYLADFTQAHNLPQKALVVHQFQTRMVTNREHLDTSRDELEIIIHIDGQGSPGAKLETYRVVTQEPPGGEGAVHWGWKNFYDEDLPMLSAQQTTEQVVPEPIMISYQ